MKKYSWILALLVALSLAFFACDNGNGGGKDPVDPVDPGPQVPTELVTIFDMQDASKGKISHGIQELPEGALSFPNNNNPIKPLVRAAEDTHADYEIIEVEGKKALKYVVKKADWGAGFDLPNSAFGFLAGDKITVTGKAEGASINLAFNKDQGKAQNIVGNRITAAGPFTVEVELTAADITAIRANEQKVLRFEDRTAESNKPVITIYNIVIVGNRPSEIKKLDAPVISIDGTTVSWEAVDGAGGYKVLALAEGGDEAKEATSLTADKLKYDLSASTLAAGKYSITVVAVGVAGSSTDSDPSNAESYTHVVATLTLKKTILGDAADWQNLQNDGPSNPGGLSLKGNISTATTTAVLAITGGEARIYWKYVGDAETGASANNGIGNFAGVGYNAGAGGAEGIAVIKIAAFDLESQPSYVPAGCLYLNVYNDCAVVKIEIWGP